MTRRRETAAYVRTVKIKSGQPRVKPGESSSASDVSIRDLGADWYWVSVCCQYIFTRTHLNKCSRQVWALVVRSFLQPKTPHDQPGVIMIQPNISNHEPHIHIVRTAIPSRQFRLFSPLAKLLFKYMNEVGEGGVICQRSCGFGVGMKSDFRSKSVEGS